MSESSTTQKDILHNYFDHTATRDWKIMDALAYYLKQNIPVQDTYALIEIDLKNATKSRKTSKKRAEALLDELNVRRRIISLNKNNLYIYNRTNIFFISYSKLSTKEFRLQVHHLPQPN